MADLSIRALATLLLSAVAAGCLVVPTPATGFQTVGTASTLARGPAGPLTLQIVLRRSSAAVSAMRPRECQRKIYTIEDITRGLQSKLVMSDIGDIGRNSDDIGAQVGAALVLALLSPVTVTVSGILTETVVHLSRPVTTRTTTLDQEIELDCSVRVAGLRLHASLPSGATVDGVTDDRGAYELAIPEGEPIGFLSVWSADHTAARTILYVVPSTSPDKRTGPTRIDVQLGAAPPDGAQQVRIDPRLVPLDRLRESNHISVELRGPAQAIADYQEALADLLRADQVVVDHWSVVGAGGSTVHAIFTLEP